MPRATSTASRRRRLGLTAQSFGCGATVNGSVHSCPRLGLAAARRSPTSHRDGLRRTSAAAGAARCHAARRSAPASPPPPPPDAPRRRHAGRRLQAAARGAGRAVLDAGQRVFGENRVQEAEDRWPALAPTLPGFELHLVGPLQTNKLARAARALRRDPQPRPRRARRASSPTRCRRGARCPTLFVQVNTGREPQKAGVDPDALDAFLAALPRLRPAGLRADGDPAGRRRSRAALRAPRRDGRAQRARRPLDGDERRLRGGDRRRAPPTSASARRSSAPARPSLRRLS